VALFLTLLFLLELCTECSRLATIEYAAVGGLLHTNQLNLLFKDEIQDMSGNYE